MAANPRFGGSAQTPTGISPAPSRGLARRFGQAGQAVLFGTYEHTDQEGGVAFQPNLASASSLGGVFPNPYSGHLISTRLDGRATENHTAFVRY